MSSMQASAQPAKVTGLEQSVLADATACVMAGAQEALFKLSLTLQVDVRTPVFGSTP
jgi:hypothetical protein